MVLLTDDNPDLEQSLEQQLRELTLLPLQYQVFEREHLSERGRPKEVTLIVTPYTTALPLFSPPLFHAEEAFSDHQQQQICKMLEA
ncbi:Stationary phase inducible protein CsiE [Klebsiella oxytoca]|nr:Stationary phase inducible protein CsiE [Klebsiella oxytoca]